MTSTASSPSASPLLVLEWTDPASTPGHWVPEMIEIAGDDNEDAYGIARQIR